MTYAHPTAAAGKLGNILLVDDDESDNNNYPGDKRLSLSDTFYRTSLKSLGRPFDAVMVPHYKNGPDLATLRPYSQVIWYTGASYGGNPDNTAVISLDDEKTIQEYLTKTGGTLILVSPGYMSNALGANGDSHWSNMTSEFLVKVMGVKGGRGLLGRFDAGQVTNTAGATFEILKNASVETQFSALNPDTGTTTLYTSPLNPDGRGARPTAVAVSHSVGSGTFVYVGFTLENIDPKASMAFGSLLQAPDSRPATPAAAPALTATPPAVVKRTAQTAALSITGTLPPPARRATTAELSITGTLPPPARRATTGELTLTGLAAPQ